MPASNTQKTIFVACRQLGIDDDARRDLQLLTTGKESLSNMTSDEKLQVLGALKAKGFKTGFKGGQKPRHARAPRADLRYVHALWGNLGRAGVLDRPNRAGLNAFIRSQFESKWQSVPIDIDKMTDPKQINAVVQSLKSMCKRNDVPTGRA